MLPGRLGLRFALEALFLVLLAIGAGLADLRPGFIVLVMAVAWLLVAIVEFTAERISASPLTYLVPQRSEPPVDEAEPAWPMPEERTVVAPPERRLSRSPNPSRNPNPSPSRSSRSQRTSRSRSSTRSPPARGGGARSCVAASRTREPSRRRRRDT